MGAAASVKSGESYHISGSVTRGESYRISGSFNNKMTVPFRYGHFFAPIFTAKSGSTHIEPLL